MSRIERSSVGREDVGMHRAGRKPRLAGQVQGTVTVTGIARSVFRRGLVVPDNDPVKGFWMSYAPTAMGHATGTPTPLPLVVEADGTTNPGGLPKGAVTRIDFRNDHLH